MFIINFESEVMILVIISFIKLLNPKSRLIITELKNFGYIKNNITYIAISDFLYCFFSFQKLSCTSYQSELLRILYYGMDQISNQTSFCRIIWLPHLPKPKTLPRKKQIWRGRSMKTIKENITSHG